MNHTENEDAGSVALYWDFENLHAALAEAKSGEGSYNKPDVRFKPQEPLVEIQPIVELAASFGRVAINRAYCNWQYFGKYRDALLQSAVELIQLFPPGPSAKNGADIKLCLDATEDLGRFAHIGTVMIVGGDSDFMPVAQKVKAAGRTLIGLGTRKNTNRHWAKACHEFRYYENLVVEAPVAAPAARADSDVASPRQTQNAAAALMHRALKLLSENTGDPWVKKATILPMIKRLDPTFDTKDYGYASFTEMMKALDKVIEVQKGEFDHEVRLR